MVVVGVEWRVFLGEQKTLTDAMGFLRCPVAKAELHDYRLECLCLSVKNVLMYTHAMAHM